MGCKRVERLMRALGLEGAHSRRPKPITTTPAPGVEVCDDLLARDFSPPAPDLTWVADIKFVETAEGPRHLAAITDCFARRVVGHTADARIEASLVGSALEIAAGPPLI